MNERLARMRARYGSEAKLELLEQLMRQETAHRNLLAAHAVEHRPQPHELRRGAGETPTAWHGATS